MRWFRPGFVLALLLILLLGTTASQEAKRLMFAITTNTEGELEPCG